MPTSNNSPTHSGPTLHRAFEALVATLNGRGIRYAIVGGLALIQHTQDQADIRELVTVYAGKLDLDFVRKEMEAFTEKEDPRRAQFELWVAQTLEGK